MKKKVLMGSVGCIAMATVLSVSTALFSSDPEIIIRMTSISYIFGLGSIGLFFVGLVTPKD